MSESKTTSSGISAMSLLAIVFITLKLTGFINWSWWWVLSPWWGPLAIFLAIVPIVFAFVVLPVWGIDLCKRLSKQFRVKP